MERRDIYKLLEYGRQFSLRMVMATCGYLINDVSISKLKQAGIAALSFSIDGATAKTHDSFRQSTGAFEAVMAAAQKAHRIGIRFQINTTITKNNIAEVASIARLAEEMCAYCFNPFILVPTGRGRKIADHILEPAEYEKLLGELLELKQNLAIQLRLTCGPQFVRIWHKGEKARVGENVKGCMAGREFGFISFRGDVQGCGFLDISAGNLIKNGYDFARIWTDSTLLNEIRDLAGYKSSCRSCEYLNSCGGCRARAYTMVGDYLAADPICSYKGAVNK